MNILHLFSANLHTGAVDHALELAEWQREQGHVVLLASDFLIAPRGLPHVTVPVHDRSFWQRLRNKRTVRRLVQEHGIHVVHAHSRAASATANGALKGLSTALVSTVHGRQHAHFKSKNFDAYGEKIIAISPALKEHLVEDLNKRPSKIAVIPNGLRFPDRAPEAPADGQTLALIGRLSGPKGARAAVLFEQVFPALLDRFPALKLLIVGGTDGPIPGHGDVHLAALKARFGDRVATTGFVPDIGPAIQEASVVIGAGRVALRALHAGRSVAALGEAGFAGLVRADTVDDAAAGNFGDTGDATPLDTDRILDQLTAFFGEPEFRRGITRDQKLLAEWTDARYNIDRIAPYIFGVYTEARMRRLQRGWLPVLMYHKVPDAPLDTPHRIFVVKDRFEKHLQWMAKRGLTPVTFSDYDAVARGERLAGQWPKRPVVLTFDDGYESVFTNAFPRMQERGWRGVLYLLGDRSARVNFWDAGESSHPESRLMTDDQARALFRAGWDLGAHTLSHPHLDQLPAAEAAREISESKRLLEEAFGVPARSFAYPFGAYTDAVVQAAWDAGFETAVATDTGGLRLEDDRFRIFRVNVFPEETWFSLRKKTSSWYRDYYFRKRGK